MSSENLSTRLVEIEALLDRSRRRFEEGSRLVEEAHQALGEIQQLILGSPVSLSAEDNEEVASRLLASLDDPDVVVRLWAAFAVSRRLPLDEAQQLKLAWHLGDESQELRDRVRWTFRVQGAASPLVLDELRRRDPALAASLVPPDAQRDD